MKKIKVALIGFGYWGPNLLRNLSKHPKVEVKYVCDLSLDCLKRAKSNYPSIIAIQDYEKIINDKEVTCVVVAVPTSEHYKISRELILAGKNVLIEKPMTIIVKEAQDLIKLAADKKVVLCVDHPYIFSEPIKKIKLLINQGKLGKLYYYNSIRASLGRIDKSTNVFVDLAPHDLAILDYLLDKEEPETVYVNGSSFIFHQPKYIENGILSLKYKSGFTANIYLNWLSPVKIRHITLAGSKKMIVNDDMNVNRLRIFNSSIEIAEQNIKYKFGKAVALNIVNNEPLYEVIDSFIQAVLYKKPALNDGTLGLRVVKILERINKSIY